jgi:hypothetical protein
MTFHVVDLDSILKFWLYEFFFLASDCTVLYHYFLLYQTYQRYEYIIKKKVIDILLHTSSQNAKN